MSIDRGTKGIPMGAATLGGGGTTDYTALTNKPQINSVELTGNKTSADLGLQPAGDYALSSEIPNVTNYTFNSDNFETEQTLTFLPPAAFTAVSSSNTANPYALRALSRRTGVDEYQVFNENNGDLMFFNSGSSNIYYRTFSGSASNSNIFSNKLIKVIIRGMWANTRYSISNISCQTYNTANASDVTAISMQSLVMPTLDASTDIKELSFYVDLRGQTSYGLNMPCTVQSGGTQDDYGVLRNILFYEVDTSGATINLLAATTSTLGGVKVDGSTITINAGNVISASTPVATVDAAGIVKPDGTTITVDASGTLSVSSLETRIAALEAKVTALEGGTA